MDLLCNDGRLLNVREDALRDRTFVDGAGDKTRTRGGSSETGVGCQKTQTSGDSDDLRLG